MTQLELIDPRSMPTASQAMLADESLRDAIALMRSAGLGVARSNGTGWPYVEHLLDVEDRPVWAVEDAGVRYVVVGGMVFTAEGAVFLKKRNLHAGRASSLKRADELALAAEPIRKAARAVFARLDAIGKGEAT